LIALSKIKQDYLLRLTYSAEELTLKESTLSLIMVKFNLFLDLPLSKEAYLHRIGRAGRFNTKGIAINFVCLIGD
jgi:hypothetical protein